MNRLPSTNKERRRLVNSGISKQTDDLLKPPFSHARDLPPRYWSSCNFLITSCLLGSLLHSNTCAYAATAAFSSMISV